MRRASRCIRSRPSALKPVLEQFKAAGKPFKMGMVFPVSTHNYELRYWLAAGGMHPGLLLAVGRDRADRAPTCCISVTPPPQMPATLEAGTINGYCVGEPWNQQAIFKGVGVPVITDYEIWKNNPEKVFGVTKAWAEKNPNTHLAHDQGADRAPRSWLDARTARTARKRRRFSRSPQYVGADVPRDRQQHDRHLRVRPGDKRARAGLQRVLPLPRHLSVLLATPSGT